MGTAISAVLGAEDTGRNFIQPLVIWASTCYGMAVSSGGPRMKPYVDTAHHRYCCHENLIGSLT
jgi:hypothetical protein